MQEKTRIIEINAIKQSLKVKFIPKDVSMTEFTNALLSLHAFTGCDTVSANHYPSTLFKSRQHNTTHLGAVNTLLHRARPDIVVNQQNRITVIELTCPYETNSISSREYKQKRYENLRCELLTPPSQFDLILLKITSLWFINTNIESFRTFLKNLNINQDYVISKCQEVAVRASYFIYCRRNKEWTSPDIISYD